MEVEEIFDILGSNYSYTFDRFLEEITPRTASRLIQIIDIRLHNEYCKQGWLHGADPKKLKMIKRPSKINKLDKKTLGQLEKGSQKILQELQNGKR